MVDVFLAPVAVTYFAVVAALFVFGVNFAYLTWSAVRTRAARPRASEPGRPISVCVQIPIFNERYVAERVIDAVARMRYPISHLEIQVLDDSTDDTSEIIDRRISYWRGLGVPIRVIRRPHRHGYKAGALQHGLALTDADLIAVFDADFAPGEDFLERSVPVLHADPGLAFVQARWAHLNRTQSMLTRVQAMSIDGHFAIEQHARWVRGHSFNFNGTAGIWRRSAIDDAGGWSQRTLTEDLDLSYRAFMRGWRAAFVADLEVPAELPVSHIAYRRQQHRWARGSLECAARLIPALWASDMRLRDKLEGTLHLCGYVIHLLLLSLAVLFPMIVAVSRTYPTLLELFGLMAILNIAALAPTGLFLSGQNQIGRRWYRQLPTVVALTLFGVGMMVNTARAAVQAFGTNPGVFERTPKFGTAGHTSNWRRLRYQGGLDPTALVELAVAALCGYTVVAAASAGVVAIAIYAGLFAAGLTLNATLTIGQYLRVIRFREVVSAAADIESGTTRAAA